MSDQSQNPVEDNCGNASDSPELPLGTKVHYEELTSSEGVSWRDYTELRVELTEVKGRLKILESSNDEKRRFRKTLIINIIGGIIVGAALLLVGYYFDELMKDGKGNP